MSEQETNNSLKLIVSSSGIIKIEIDSFSKSIIDFQMYSDIHQLKWKGSQYVDVDVYCLTDFFTLIPSPIFQESELQSYLKYASTYDVERLRMYSNSVCLDKIKLVWGVEKTILSQLIKAQSGSKINSFIASYLNTIDLSKKENKIYSIFISNELLIVFVLDGEIKIVNKFDITTIEDALYYHLLFLQSSELEGENINLKTGGIYEDLSSFINRIEDYFNKVERYVDLENNNDVDDAGILDMIKVLRK